MLFRFAWLVNTSRICGSVNLFFSIRFLRLALGATPRSFKNFFVTCLGLSGAMSSVTAGRALSGMSCKSFAVSASRSAIVNSEGNRSPNSCWNCFDLYVLWHRVYALAFQLRLLVFVGPALQPLHYQLLQPLLLYFYLFGQKELSHLHWLPLRFRLQL